MDLASPRRLKDATARIVSAHAAAHIISRSDLLLLIQRVYQTLKEQQQPEPAPARSGKAPLIPAVPPDQSVFPDHIICLEDGKKYRLLKRHLIISYHMTPQQYRERWGLSPDYPMVAPDLKQERAAKAKKFRQELKRATGARRPEQSANHPRSW